MRYMYHAVQDPASVATTMPRRQEGSDARARLLAAAMDHEATLPGIDAAQRCAMVRPNAAAG